MSENNREIRKKLTYYIKFGFKGDYFCIYWSLVIIIFGHSSFFQNAS